MKLLDSLLDAIVRLEGDALVMHVGEKPYVVTASSSMNAYRGPLAWGQVELSSRVLTFDAVSSMLGQILPADQQQALTEFGAIEHEIPSPAGVADRFTVVAARGGEDVWVEVRRRPIEIPQPVAQAEVPEPEVAAIPAAVASVAETVVEPALAEIELVTDAAAETESAAGGQRSARRSRIDRCRDSRTGRRRVCAQHRSGQRDSDRRRRTAGRSDGGRSRRDARGDGDRAADVRSRRRGHVR